MLYMLLVYATTESFYGSGNSPLKDGWHRIADCHGVGGELGAAVVLQESANATTVVVRDGEARVASGAIADGQLKLTGLATIECESYARALEIARAVRLELGTAADAVELRPISKAGCVEVIEARAKKLAMDVESASLQPSSG